MFERSAVTLPDLRALVDRLRDVPTGPDMTEAELVDTIHVLERVKSAVAAAQARVTVEFAGRQRESLTALGRSAAEQGRTIGAQVALARRVSPHQGSRHLGLAEALVHEMPKTLAALESGDTSEWRATLVARETACLSSDDRRRVDAELAARPDGLAALGDRGTADAARAVAYRLDPASALRRIQKAESERRVTIRPAPDTMTLLTGLLPVGGGMAAYAALNREVDALKAAGDARSRGQLMADVFVERLTGRATATAYDLTRWDAVPPPPPRDLTEGLPAGTDVELQLVMTDAALFGADDTAAHLNGFGPIPALLARRLVREAGDDVRIWLRRLYTRPDTGQLVAMESQGRAFTGLLRRFLLTRDQVCRTPWCDTVIRHIDHPTPVADGGETTADNSQGLCEACNYVKELPGWTARPDPDEALVVTTTPTRHQHSSRPPPLPQAS